MTVRANLYYDLYINTFIAASNDEKVSPQARYSDIAVDKFIVALALADAGANRAPMGPPQLRDAMNEADFFYEDI